jgi:hypothetical protein
MPEGPSEIFDHEWTTLQALWRRVKASTPRASSLTDEEISRIDDLLPATPVFANRAVAWAALNVAEQEVGAHLPWALLVAEYAIVLDIARARKLPALATYEEKAAFIAAPPATEQDRARQLAIYLALLVLLQSVFIDSRFRRRLRKETALRLLWFGVMTVTITLLAPLLFVASYLGHMKDHAWKEGVGAYLFSIEPGFGLLMAASFGILGAYFSRSTDFQSKLENFSFQDVINVYQPRVLLLRLMYGMIGAVILYYLIGSGLIGGEAFPNLANVQIHEQVISYAKSDVKPKESGLTILTPTVELAKLLVWSFLAGFSERLVPDALERVHSQVTKQ